MDKVRTSWWQRHRPTTRRLAQLYCALLYNAHLRGFVEGDIYKGNAKYACVPGLNCYSCPGAVGSCPLGALQNALAASGTRAGWYVPGILLLFALTLGRTVCGWLCPFGLLQELLHKLPSPKLRKSRLTCRLSWLKYGILALFVVALPLWYGLRYSLAVPAFCKYICPAGTAEGAVGLLANPKNSGLYALLGAIFTRKLVILLLVGLACVFCYRVFCRFLCPLGALYGLFSRLALVGVRVEESRCTGCGACVRACEMDVRRVGDRECIHCGKCMDVCAAGAISLKAGRITLQAPARGCPDDAPEKRRRRTRIAWCAALLLLAGALLWFNVLDPAVQRDGTALTEEIDADGVPLGTEPGTRLEDFTIRCLDGSEFRLAETRGQAVFLNLWATYCAPCVRELPAFDALAREHEGETAVLAIHAAELVDDVEAFLAGTDWAIPFAIDTEDGRVWNCVGGGSVLPQTIVLDRSGTVIYNQVGSVTPELLESLFEQASGQD